MGFWGLRFIAVFVIRSLHVVAIPACICPLLTLAALATSCFPRLF